MFLKQVMTKKEMPKEESNNYESYHELSSSPSLALK